MDMTRAAMIDFCRQQRLGVVSTISPNGEPQGAVMGIAVTEDFEVIFDTLDSSRKCANLRRDPRIAIVIGWDGEVTVQYEGIADEPTGAERERILAEYFIPYPDGRDRLKWPGITHFRVRPVWARYSDFNPGGQIVEFTKDQLRTA